MSLHVQNLNAKLTKQSLGKVITAVLEYLNIEAGLSENTILGYGRDLNDFAAFCHSKAIKKPADIKAETLFSYVKSLAKQSKAEASINRAVVAIKMFLRFCRMMGHIEEDLTVFLESPKLWQKLPIVCSK